MRVTEYESSFAAKASQKVRKEWGYDLGCGAIPIVGSYLIEEEAISDDETHL